MLSMESVRELHSAWFPNVTDAGLERIIDLLEKSSPLLIHGSFTRAIPMGCLATHIGWNHPETDHLTMDAGICWLNHVAGLNPATSHLIREWDRSCSTAYETRAEILRHFKQERDARRGIAPAQRSRLPEAETVEPVLAD